MTDFPQPQGGNEMPRFAGRGTMMRLPAVESPADLDVAFVGIPLDIGTSQRSGTRYGPRAIRADSVMIRPYNMATGAAPFDSLRVGDLGDVPINTYSLLKSVDIIENYYTELNNWPIIPLTLGGDHTLTLPILRALAKKHGPMGLIHIDAHTDTNDEMFGEKVAHGTTFRRAVEEGQLDCQRVVQMISSGASIKASIWCLPNSAGIDPWRHSWLRCVRASVTVRCISAMT